MSGQDSFDVSEKTAPPAKPEKHGSERIRYLYSYSAVFSNPNWFMNLLLGGICPLIPIIGQIVLVGYIYEVIECLHRRRGPTYPDFDFGRFVPYLSRGAWPWLIVFGLQFILQIPVMIVIYGSMFGIMGIALADEFAGIVTASIVIPVVFIGLIVFSMVLTVFLVPMMLRAGLSQDIGQAFQFGWLKDFVRRMWLETILISLFMVVTSSLVVFIGMAIFCVGVIPAAMLTNLASAYLVFQLYELFLARGGEPIPLKDDPKSLPPVEPEFN